MLLKDKAGEKITCLEPGEAYYIHALNLQLEIFTIIYEPDDKLVT